MSVAKKQTEQQPIEVFESCCPKIQINNSDSKNRSIKSYILATASVVETKRHQSNNQIITTAAESASVASAAVTAESN